SAVWCLGYRYAPGWIDWWKMWELHAGFNLGMLYALTLFWATRQVNTTHTEATPVTPENGPKPAAFSNSRNALFPAIVGFLLIFAVGMEYFLWTGLLLALFYAVSVGITVQFKEKRASEIRKGISLTYSVFLLLFLLAQGGSSRFGVLLGMYGPEAIEQYDWPVERIALFAPVAVILFSIAVMYIVKHYRAQSQVLRLPERMIDLCTFITLTGAVSIWPAKIGVLYIFFLCLALFAFTRIERHYLYEGNNQ
ncbi:MAG: hypothetical protein KAH38_04140, partial [Candidatus Hydrogenedentes bacterium]|nr:hypothetical protein [Candidatus Hydrogenedentota bacterium]